MKKTCEPYNGQGIGGLGVPSGRQKTWSFVLALIMLPILLVAASAMILGHYGLGIDILNALVAAGTVELAVVASLQDRIRGWLMAPQLDIEVSPSDFHGTYDNGSKVYYSRFQVCNKGEASAEKVEVMLKRVYRKEGGRFKADDSITSDNLLWSTIGGYDTIPNINQFGVLQYVKKFIPATYCSYIAPGTRKHCTLGHIYEPTHRSRDEYGEPRFQVPPNDTVFCLEVSFKTNLRNYFLSKGTYGIELQVAASNARVVTRRFRIEVTGKWSPDDEDTMAREGFKIEEVKCDFDKYEEKTTSREEASVRPEGGTSDNKKPVAETAVGSQQPSPSGAASQTATADQEKKEEKEEVSKN